uniref:DUF7086 domain-containing protein n=1 Tax=Ananas comosus var. bracteatus TaxID=296719 RepID=A0A6V7Q9L4_ANACO|nr:unnamed protein product [Ananas comosus var. bracteatus]
MRRRWSRCTGGSRSTRATVRRAVCKSRSIYKDCLSCRQEKRMQPVVAQRLFMLLGGTLGCLNMRTLTYFCRHNGYHSTGADCKLYYAFAGLCMQLIRKQE